MIALHNARILEFYPPSVSDECDIIISEDTIIDTGKDLLKNYIPNITIDLTGKFISPGLVCSHNHFYSFLSRGIMADIRPASSFREILENLWWKLDRALDEESVYYSSICAALEAIKCGTTSVTDHHASPSFIRGSLGLLRSAFEKAGLRGLLAYEITDRNGEKDVKVGIEETVSFILSDKGSSLIKGSIGAHASFTLSNKTLSMLREVMDVTGRGIHIHTAEDKYDQLHSYKHYNESVIRRLSEFGLLNDKAILAHGVNLDEGELEIINDYDSFLVHNPRSNMNNNVGYLDKLNKLKNPALGTDGIGSDMFEELKFAFFRNREETDRYETALLLESLNNGNKILERYFGKRFGKIEKGYPADIVIYNYNPPTPLCSENLAGHLLFGSIAKDIETVIIDGNVVYENRSFPFDTSEIYSAARQSAQKLWERINEL